VQVELSQHVGADVLPSDRSKKGGGGEAFRFTQRLKKKQDRSNGAREKGKGGPPSHVKKNCIRGLTDVKNGAEEGGY